MTAEREGEARATLPVARITLLSLPIVFILLAGAIKNDAADFLVSDYWSGLNSSAFVLSLKSSLPYTYLLSAGAMLVAALAGGKIRIELSAPVAAIFAMYLLLYFRLNAGDGLIGQRYGATAAFFSVLALFLMRLHEEQLLARVVDRGMALAVAALVLINACELHYGFGTVPGVDRLFGTSGHPNFIGVQAAIGSVYLLGRLGERDRRALIGTVLLLALGLVVVSGSRTAVIVALSGAAVLLWAQTGLARTLVVVLTAGLLLAAVLILGGVDLPWGSAFDRGGINTRWEAWNALLADALENPVWGIGAFPDYSENSYLRGWAMVGVGFPVLVAGAGGLTIWRVIKAGLSERLDTTLLAIFAALLIGALFEGYLVEANSFTVLVWFIAAVSLNLRAGAAR